MSRRDFRPVLWGLLLWLVVATYLVATEAGVWINSGGYVGWHDLTP